MQPITEFGSLLQVIGFTGATEYLILKGPIPPVCTNIVWHDRMNDLLPIMGDNSLMTPKAHGSCPHAVQSCLRFGVDAKKADRICCFNRSDAEESGYFKKTRLIHELKAALKRGGVSKVTFFDSVCGKPMFIIPKSRSLEDFIEESEQHGWPSFHDEEVVWDNVRCLNDGEVVSIDGVHLGHNVPVRTASSQGGKVNRFNPHQDPDFDYTDSVGSGFQWQNRYCINLMSIAGMKSKQDEPPRALEMIKNPTPDSDVLRECMASTPSHAGFAKKKNRRERWQTRWYEIRTPYLLYWPSKPAKAIPHGAGLTEKQKTKRRKSIQQEDPAPPSSSTPKGVLDLRSVQTAQIKPGRGKMDDGKVLLIGSTAQWVELKFATAEAAVRWAEAVSETLQTLPDEQPTDDPAVGQQEAEEAPKIDPQEGQGVETPHKFVGNRPLAYSLQRMEDELPPPSPNIRITCEDTFSLKEVHETSSSSFSSLPPPPTQDPPKAPKLSEELSSTHLEVEEASLDDLVPPHQLWPPDFEVRIVPGPKQGSHPTYVAQVFAKHKIQPSAGCTRRFADWRELHERLNVLGVISSTEPRFQFGRSESFKASSFSSNVSEAVSTVTVEKPFPRTYRRNSLGIRLSDAQVQERADKLDCWFQGILPDTSLPMAAANALVEFLNLNELRYFQEWRRSPHKF